jgi:hypothetical protein
MFRILVLHKNNVFSPSEWNEMRALFVPPNTFTDPAKMAIAKKFAIKLQDPDEYSADQNPTETCLSRQKIESMVHQVCIHSLL